MPLAKKVAHVNGHVTGLDLQPEMIEKTKLKAETQLIKNIDFISGGIEKVSINQIYDIILMVCVLGEIPKKTHPTVMKKLAAHLLHQMVLYQSPKPFLIPIFKDIKQFYSL